MTKNEEAVVKACILCGFATREISLNIMHPKCVNIPTTKYWRTMVNKYTKKLNIAITLLLKNKKEDLK